MENFNSLSACTPAGSDSDLAAPYAPGSPGAEIEIHYQQDEAGLKLVVPRIPDAYFNGNDSLTAFMGAGTRPGITDRKVNVLGDGGNFVVKKGATSTTVTCEPGAFSNIVEDLGIGSSKFYVRYAFGASPGHVSQPATAKFQAPLAIPPAQDNA